MEELEYMVGEEHRGTVISVCREEREPCDDGRIKVKREYTYIDGMFYMEYYYKTEKELKNEDARRKPLTVEQKQERKQKVDEAKYQMKAKEAAKFKKLEEAVLQQRMNEDCERRPRRARRASLFGSTPTTLDEPEPERAHARDDSSLLAYDPMDTPAMRRAKQRLREKQLGEQPSFSEMLSKRVSETVDGNANQGTAEEEAERERRRLEKERKKKEKERKRKEKEERMKELADERIEEEYKRYNEIAQEHSSLVERESMRVAREQESIKHYEQLEARIDAVEQKRREEEHKRMEEDHKRKDKAKEEALRRLSDAKAFAAAKKDEQAKRLREAEEAHKKAEAEARKKGEAEEARRKAEAEEARRKAEAEARKKAEEEARRKAEAEARKKAEEDARRKEEERKAKEAAEEKLKADAREKAKKKADTEAKEAIRKQNEKMKQISAVWESKRKEQQEEARRRAMEKALQKAQAESRYMSRLNLQTAPREGQRHRQKSKMNLHSEDKNKAKKKEKKTVEPVRMHTLKGKTLDINKPLPKTTKKTTEEKQLLTTELKKNPTLNGLIKSQISNIVDAFERVEVRAGSEIAKEGEEDDSLFIVQKGDVTFRDKKGDNVGGAGAGKAFGESALTYAGNRSVTVEADKSKETVLYQLKQDNYRQILRNEIIKSEEERIRLLKWVPFFQLVDGPDLKILTNAMQPYEFKKGENLTKTFGSFPFCCLVYEGTVGLDPELFPDPDSDGLVPAGGAFGEAFAGGDDSEEYDVKCVTDGVVYTIDRKSFERVFGDMDRLTAGKTDKELLAELDIIKKAKLTDQQMETLVHQISDIAFPANRDIYNKGKKTQPNLYLLREGQVKLSDGISNGKKKIVLPGSYFGEEHFLLNANEVPKKVSATHTATAGPDTTFGVLKLPDLATIIGQAASEQEVKKKQRMKKSDVALEDLTRHRILGEGQYGIVWLVSNKKAKAPEPYALKIQLLDDPDRDDPTTAIMQEIEVMQILQSPFIIEVLNTYSEPEAISMLLSLAPGGELFDIIHQEGEDGTWTSGIGEENGKFYASVIADSIAFLHRQKYVFRDLKPENVLIDKYGYPVITDFGFAKKVEDKTYTFCGTPNYVAPEIISNRGHDVTADNWTLGILFYELIEGENPFYDEGMDQTTLFHAICNDPYYPLPEGEYSSELCELLDRLLEKEPSKRLGTFRESDILSHPWFSSYDMMELREKRIEAPWIPEDIELDDE